MRLHPNIPAAPGLIRNPGVIKEMSAFYAIASAFLYALANVITRLGLRYASTSSAVLISLLFCFASVFIYCLYSWDFC